MAKYEVTAYVTVCIEKEIEADCRDEALAKYIDYLANKYGWADFETVQIQKVEE